MICVQCKHTSQSTHSDNLRGYNDFGSLAEHPCLKEKAKATCIHMQWCPLLISQQARSTGLIPMPQEGEPGNDVGVVLTVMLPGPDVRTSPEHPLNIALHGWVISAHYSTTSTRSTSEVASYWAPPRCVEGN